MSNLGISGVMSRIACAETVLGTAVRWNQKQFAVVSLVCFIPNLIASCKESDVLTLDI